VFLKEPAHLHNHFLGTLVAAALEALTGCPACPAMTAAAWLQIKHWGPGGVGKDEPLRDGDVLASNHPQLAGGSHLPDITVITPVFNDGAIEFFVASRGHHADVGGTTPGSMPPNSHCLAEEGAAIVAFKLVRGGVFQVHRSRNVPLHICIRRAHCPRHLEVSKEQGFKIRGCGSALDCNDAFGVGKL